MTGRNDATAQLQMEAVLSYQKVNGGWAKPKLIRSKPGNGQPAFEAATETDREVLQLMRAMPASNSARYYYSYDFNANVILDGQAGVMLLEQAARTERLLLNDNDYSTVIQWGPPQPLRWEWQEIANNQAGEPAWALRAKLGDANARLCLNTPPLYFDAVRGLCGLVQAEGIPTAQLNVLLKAPALKPSARKDHQVALLQRLGNVPAPPVLEKLDTLPDVTPVACLHL